MGKEQDQGGEEGARGGLGGLSGDRGPLLGGGCGSGKGATLGAETTPGGASVGMGA